MSIVWGLISVGPYDKREIPKELEYRITGMQG
jgi:hypothetical protein